MGSVSTAISGGFGSSKSSSSTTTRSSGTSSQKLSGTQVTTTLDDTSKEILNAFTRMASQQFASGVSGFSKENAISDAQGIVSGIFNQFRQVLPQIYNAGLQTGTYNSTQQQSLADQAYGQAVANASSAVLQNIKDYASIANSNQQTAISALATALGIQTQAQQTTTVDQAQNAQFQNTSTSNTSSGGSGWNIGIAHSESK